MENAPDEEPTEFLEPVEEIVENVIEEQEVHEEEVHEGEMIQVQHEEVLEEIVEEDGMMYDTDGRVVEYRDVMVYEDGSEVIEEYVEVEDLGNGEFAYVMTDEHGNRRLLKPEEVEAVKKMPELMEEVLVDPKTIEAGPSTSTGYANHKRGRFPPKSTAKQPRSNMRNQSVKSSHMMYMDRGAYYPESSSKGINDMAKVEVEKYVPAVTVNRRPLPDNHGFKQKVPRSRKSQPWQEESSASTSGGPSTSAGTHRSPSPVIKEPLFPIQEDDIVIRFKCPECGDGFPNMTRLCEHMIKNHDCQTNVREADFFRDVEFDNFLAKVEKATLGNEADDLRKKARAGVSQIFVCNYMNKGRQKNAELAEVGLAALAERPIEVCTAFVQKIQNYENIHVKYCDQHIHYDGNIGFRVPIAVKRRLFEMSFKRLPIPCMQAMLGLEAEHLLPHPTRFEEKLRNLSHVEIVELLGIINASLRKYQEVEPKGRKVPIKFDTIKTSDGNDTLVVKRASSPKKQMAFKQDKSDEPSTSADAKEFTLEGQDVPMMAREEEVSEEAEENPETSEGCDGLMEDNMLYDPKNNRDPLFDELTEVELGVLEAYERDINVELTEEQKKERIRHKAKFSLAKVIGIYQSLDTATHGLSAAELHTDTINQLREMASYVVELCCQLDAEVKSQFNPALRVDDIKRDMIAGIAMQERVYQPERRQRRNAGLQSHQTPSPMKPHYRSHPPARSHEEYTERIMNKVKELQTPPHRQLGNVSDSFDISQQQRLQMLRDQTLRSTDDSLEPEVEEKPSAIMAPVPEEYKAIPWSKPPRKRQAADPNAPPKKRGRPNKKGESSEVLAKNVDSSSEMVAEEQVEKTQEESTIENPQAKPVEAVIPVTTSDSVETLPEKEAEQEGPIENTEVTNAEKSLPESKDEPSTSLNPTTTATKTRTGRVVKPKKWEE